MPTSATDQPPTSGGPVRASPTVRTDKTGLPTTLDEVIPTSLVRGESILKFKQGSRVVLGHAGGRLPIVAGRVNCIST
jgi:hypothetical protein